MPTATIKKMAKRAKKSIKRSEELWEKAKGISKKKFKEDHDAFYPYTMGIFRRMMGLTSANFVRVSPAKYCAIPMEAIDGSA